MNKRTIVQTFVDIKSTNDLENALEDPVNKINKLIFNFQNNMKDIKNIINEDIKDLKKIL